MAEEKDTQNTSQEAGADNEQNENKQAAPQEDRSEVEVNEAASSQAAESEAEPAPTETPQTRPSRLRPETGEPAEAGYQEREPLEKEGEEERGGGKASASAKTSAAQEKEEKGEIPREDEEKLSPADRRVQLIRERAQRRRQQKIEQQEKAKKSEDKKLKAGQKSGKISLLVSGWIVGLGYLKDAADAIFGGFDLGIVGAIVSPVFILLILFLGFFVKNKSWWFYPAFVAVGLLEMIPIINILPIFGPAMQALMAVEKAKGLAKTVEQK